MTRVHTSVSPPQVGQASTSPDRYPCAGQIENVGVTVMYGSRWFSSARWTSLRQASGVEIRSDMYRCRTVPPVYFVCSSSWRSRASNGSSVKPTGSCEELV